MSFSLCFPFQCTMIFFLLQRIESNWRTGRHTLQRIHCRSETSKGVYCLQYDDSKIISGLRDNTIKVYVRVLLYFLSSKCSKRNPFHHAIIVTLSFGFLGKNLFMSEFFFLINIFTWQIFTFPSKTSTCSKKNLSQYPKLERADKNGSPNSYWISPFHSQTRIVCIIFGAF